MRWSLLAIILCQSLSAQFPGANELLKRVAHAQPANETRSKQYTATEQCDRFDYDSKGRPKLVLSETSEVIFVEGIEYKKLTTRNGKPLSAKEKAKVEQEMSKTAEERRRTGRKARPGGRVSLGGQNVDLGDPNDLIALFDNRIVSEDTVEGSQVWVMECIPKPGFEVTNKHESDVLTFQRKLWITKDSALPIRIIYTAVVNHDFVHPGSTLTLEYQAVGEDTWHPSRFGLNMFHPKGKTFVPWKRADYVYSNFKKFDVQSTITVDPVN